MYEKRFIELLDMLSNEDKKNALLELFNNAKFTDKLALIVTVENYIEYNKLIK